MKKIILFLLIIPVLGYSQIHSGEVIYKIKKLEEIEEPDNPSEPKNQAEQMAQANISHIYKQIEKALPYLQFQLKFNKNKSQFEHNKYMDSDSGEEIGYAIDFMNGRGVFYTNIEEDTVLNQSEFLNKLFLIEDKISDINWDLKDEFQTIAGYKCQKAITQIYVNAKHPEVDIPVWFAKDLPFSFGPIGMAGLPGLILGLERNGHMYYAQEINLSEKEIKINPPKKGKRLTEKQFRAYVKELKENPLEAVKILEEAEEEKD